MLAFTDQCVAGPDVTDAAFAAAHAVLTDRQLTTVIVLIGHYRTVARLTGVLQSAWTTNPATSPASTDRSTTSLTARRVLTVPAVTRT